jgi:hypothetical protein
MKNPIALFTILLVSLFATTQAFSQTNPTESATADASATIIMPIAITNTDGLSFGNLIASTSVGTATVSATSTPTISYDGISAPATEGDISAATFTVTGFSDSFYDITLPTSTTISNGSATMTLNAFTHNASEVLDGGTETFQVGATLNVAAEQAAGDYSGTFEVSVNYN